MRYEFAVRQGSAIRVPCATALAVARLKTAGPATQMYPVRYTCGNLNKAGRAQVVFWVVSFSVDFRRIIPPVRSMLSVSVPRGHPTLRHTEFGGGTVRRTMRNCPPGSIESRLAARPRPVRLRMTATNQVTAGR
jgi:hypothetical protein